MNPVNRSVTPDRRPAAYLVPAEAENALAKVCAIYKKAVQDGKADQVIASEASINALIAKHPQLAAKAAALKE